MGNNFNEDFLNDLKREGIEHGKIKTIPKEMKGTAKDYAELERRIILEASKHESYTQ